VLAAVLCAAALLVWTGQFPLRSSGNAPKPERRIAAVPAAAADAANHTAESAEGALVGAAAQELAESSAEARARLQRALDLLAGPLAPGRSDPLEAIREALDPRAELARRIAAVRALAGLERADAVRALAALLADAALEPALREEAAEALAASPHARARELAAELLWSEDEALAAAVLRGLGARGDAAELLRAVLLDADQPLALRAEAAAALGRQAPPEAARALAEAFAGAQDPELAASALEGLARQDFAQVEGAFRSVLESPALDAALKRAALEALSEAGSGAAPLLLEHASGAADPQLRAAAVDALALLDEDEPLGEQGSPSGAAPERGAALLGLLEREREPEVRSALYAALAFERDALGEARSSALLPAILAERDPELRLGGYRLAASLLGSGATDTALGESFEREMLPWLRAQALRAPASDARLGALDAMRRAGTPGAAQALRELAASPDFAVARAAQSALRALPTP
jgi:hypothetical protein